MEKAPLDGLVGYSNARNRRERGGRCDDGGVSIRFSRLFDRPHL